ncbi:MAG TPA: hypothetical protein VFQ92_24935, partial [Blastocatellia bacterium]|nr:hypothetical protein [Blastocatellia bacterium]
ARAESEQTRNNAIATDIRRLPGCFITILLAKRVGHDSRTSQAVQIDVSISFRAIGLEVGPCCEPP